MDNYCPFEIHCYIWTKVDRNKMKQPTSFSEHIRHLRVTAELSLRQVANDLRIDPSLLAKFERNERRPTKDLIKIIEEY